MLLSFLTIQLSDVMSKLCNSLNTKITAYKNYKYVYGLFLY